MFEFSHFENSDIFDRFEKVREPVLPLYTSKPDTIIELSFLCMLLDRKLLKLENSFLPETLISNHSNQTNNFILRAKRKKEAINY